MMSMRSQKTQSPNDREQAKAFRKAARELGADTSEDRFKDVLRTIAKAKPAPEKRKNRD
jgi:hypothetical protein